MMVQAEAILIDDETVPMVQALESRAVRLTVVSDDGPIVDVSEEALRLLRSMTYVPLDHAAALVGTVPVAVKSMIRRGLLAGITRDGLTYVSLQSALDYRDQQPARSEEAFAEMIRVSEEGGLYDAEFGTS